MKVLHLKFGEGEVISIDGARDNRVASIRFDQMDNSERRIMLRFAKLQILDS
jgi:DNA helicase-2/ATP-dependent DNA helicase PcrA